MIHEVVGPAALAGLDAAGIDSKLHCKLCGTPSFDFRETADAPHTLDGELGYPAVVLPMFNASLLPWWQARNSSIYAAVKYGLPWRSVVQLARTLSIEPNLLGEWIGACAVDVQQGVAAGTWMDQTQAGVLAFLARRIGEAEELHGAQRADRRDAGRWVGAWLRRDDPVLGDRPPGDFLSTPARLAACRDSFTRAAQSRP